MTGSNIGSWLNRVIGKLGHDDLLSLSLTYLSYLYCERVIGDITDTFCII